MKESEKRLHRCCFTGHRPEKLKVSENTVKEKLEQEILQAISEGFYVFISGMARGTDIFAAEIVLRLRGEGHDIRLICASPYEGFENKWSEEWQTRYNRILDDADIIRFISPGYSSLCFQDRNKWMIQHSSKVIAVYNGETGGTKNTIALARKAGIAVSIIKG